MADSARMREDPRVRRSRAALFGAVVKVVSERGTTDISVTDVTTTADLSRRVFYQHFGDLDTLFIAAAQDLLEREVLPVSSQPEDLARDLRKALVHLVEHRSFYRAVLTGSSGYRALATAKEFLGPHSVAAAAQTFPNTDSATHQTLGAYFAGATILAIVEWLDTAGALPDVDDFIANILRIQGVLGPGRAGN